MIAPRLPGARCLWLFLGLALLLLAAPAVTLAQDIQVQILEQTAQVRGLAPRAPVPFAFVNPATLRAQLLESFEDETSVREIEISRKLLVMLGLLNPDADLHSILVDLYAENIQGYYSHEDKQMYVVSDVEEFGPEAKITLAHEMTHALQDQYFNLTAMRERVEENGDHDAALSALIEGDATLTMILYAREFLSPDELILLQTAGGDSSIDRTPLVIRDEVLFPYQEGAFFAQRLFQEGGFEAINRAFANPPTSTEQIMHPEKYLAGEQPIGVTLPDLAAALGGGWQVLRTDVFGELDARILLDQFIDPLSAAVGSTGWGGDRYAYLENPTGQSALLLNTVWDSEAEAVEFANSYVEVVQRRFGRRAERVESNEARIVWNTPNGVQLLHRWGANVLIVLAPDTRVAETIAAAIVPGLTPLQPLPASRPLPAPAQVPR